MTKCRICGHLAKQVLDLGEQPFANKYPKDKSEILVEKKLSMIIEFCNSCKSAQIQSLVDRKLMFEDYYYLSSVNTELSEHFKTFAKTKLSDSKFVLDIGSNDGVLLRPLKEMGIKCIGIDPSKNVGDLANSEGLDTIIGFFDEASAHYIKQKLGKPDTIVASSVFTHIETPQKFVDDLTIVCAGNTSVYIEIEYLSNLISNLQFERFYFDRPHYYSVHGMKKLFSKSGFELTDVEEISPHGGSLRLKFNLKNSHFPVSKKVNFYLEKEIEELSLSNILEFAKSVTKEAEFFKNAIIKLKKENKKIAGYGCPARLATITNFCNVGSDLIDFIAEDSQLKIDRFSPGKHIPILNSKELHEQNFDLLIIFAYEYFDSIRKKTDQFKVPYYFPIPFKRIES